MNYSKKDFARDLRLQLDSGNQPGRIGSWAHQMYLLHCGRIDKELEEALVDLFVLEEGKEFEIPEKELRELVSKMEK